MAFFEVSEDKKDQIEKFLFHNKCHECIQNSTNIDCTYKTDTKIDMLKTIEALCEFIEQIKKSR